MAEYLTISSAGVPWFGAGTLAARPAAGQPGRLYLVVEVADIYLSRDTGVSWRDIRSGETAAQILAKLLTVDGAGSGLDADTLSGTTLAALVTEAEHTKALHDALGINAATLGGTTLAALVTEAEHTKALHDALGINAATLGGSALSALLLASQRGAAEGVAELVGGLVPENRIPAVAITDVFEVASQAAMLALTVERGDVAVRSDNSPMRMCSTS